MILLYHLIGFVLAHACWIVADLPKGETLAPFAIIEYADGTRELAHFEATTQEEAVTNGKAFMANPPQSAVRIAFVRDGLLRGADGRATDVLSVTGWTRGEPDVVVSQTYGLDSTLGFRLLAEPFVALGQVSNEPVAINQVLDGVRDHPQAGKLWASWRVLKRAS